MVTIISADEIKKELPDYSPDKAELFHRESARQADRLFANVLKNSHYNKVILLSGGTASGKTEFMSTHLNHRKCIIFDATLATEEGARIKIKKIFQANKTLEIYSIMPDDLKRAFIAFLNRDRKFSDEHFYKTHSGSRKTLLWIASEYPKVKINVIESSYTPSQKLQFARIKFDSKKQFMDYLVGIQMTEDDIISVIKSQF